MADFFVLIKDLVKQVGFGIQDMRPEGFLIGTVVQPRLMYIYISPATSDTVYFWIPEEILLFKSRREIPDWLPAYLERRTKNDLAKWNLNEAEDGYVYMLEYMAKISDLSPEFFEKICMSAMKERLSFSIWANSTIRKQNCKSLTDINPKLADLNL